MHPKGSIVGLLAISSFEFLVRRHLLADDVEEEIDGRGTHELEVVAKRAQRSIKIAVGAKIAAERPMFAVQLDHPLGIAHNRGELAAVADDPFVLSERLYFEDAEIGDLVNVKVVEGLLDSGPLGFNYTPGHAALKDGLAHNC